MALFERTTGPLTTAQGDLQVQQIELNDILTADTFTLTHGGQTTGTITYNATTATFAAAIETALEALSSVGDVEVQGVDDDTFIVHGDGNLQAITITGATGFTPTGVTTAFAAKRTVSLGSEIAEVLRVRAGLFQDAATNNVLIRDAAGRTILDLINVDLNVSGQLYDNHIGYDGVDQAGNAAADTLAGVFESPATVTVTTGAAASGSVVLFTDGGYSHAPRYHRRRSGVITTDASGDAVGQITLGGANKLAKIKRVKAIGWDSSTDLDISDVYGKKVYDVSATALDAGVDVVVGSDGIDSGGAAAANVLEGVVKGDLVVTIAAGGNALSGTVEVLTEA